LEETAGLVLGILPTRELALLEPEEDPRKEQIASQVEDLLVERARARESKDWAKADQIRDQLTEMGVVVVDSADGPTWDLV
jgi:cysteinyl-tRNA synthetase